MYTLNPAKVYMLDRVQDDPLCVRRMDRMLDAIGRTRSDATTLLDCSPSC